MERTTINGEKVLGSYVLWPRDNRASFYGKCHVYKTDTYNYLESYDTLMCRIKKDDKTFEKLDGYKSQTTSRHLRSFFADQHLDMDTKRFYAMDVNDTTSQQSDDEWFDDFKTKYDSLCDTTKKHLANSGVMVTSKEQADAVMNMSLLFDLLFRAEEKDND